MRIVKSVLYLKPLLILAIVSVPSPKGGAVAQEAPVFEATQGAPVIELFKGSRVERVGIGGGDPSAAEDSRSIDGAEDWATRIEYFKGGDTVVLTVVPSDRNVPVSVHLDAIKSARSGPTSLIPFQPRATDTMRRDGPTNLIPMRSAGAGAGATVGSGPTNLIPVRSPGTGSKFGDRPARLFTSPQPLAGVELRDLPADAGVRVESVDRASPAWRDGLRQSDVIAAVYRKRVRSAAALESELASAGDTAVLQVRRGGQDVVVVLHR